MKIFCVNTNKKFAGEGWRKRFYYENRVFTCCLKNVDLDSIEQGDIVLAYHNDKRIVGVGVAVEKYSKDECEEIKYLPVKWLWYSLDEEFINVEEIGDISMFNRTVINWTDSIYKEKLLEKLSEKIAQKGLK